MNEFAIVISVLLTTPKDVFDFAHAASQIPHDVSVDAIHGSYAVEARSVMGVLSLNLSEPITIKIVGSDASAEKYVEYFSKWIVGVN